MLVDQFDTDDDFVEVKKPWFVACMLAWLTFKAVVIWLIFFT